MSQVPSTSSYLEGLEARLQALFDLHPPDVSDTQPDAEEDAPPAASPELRAVTHRIASQFVEVISIAATRILGTGGADISLRPMQASLDSLTRLGVAADDAEHLALLEELRDALDTYDQRRAQGRGHARFRDTLRAWLPRYAAFVGGDQGDRIRELVEFDSRDVPLFTHLHQLRGIGPKRLQRLYAAGLYEAATLADADPDDTADVTGLPRKLAHDVVAASQRHREVQRQRLVHDLPSRLEEFSRVVSEVRRTGDVGLLTAAKASYQEMLRILDDLGRIDELD